MENRKNEEHEPDTTEVILDLSEDEETEDQISEQEVVKEEKIDPVKELEDKFLRLQAEFDNYRKRMESRFSEIAKYAAEGIILKVLEIRDNVERALSADFEADPKSAKQGIEGIEQQISKILAQEDVRPIVSLDKPFDPYYHNAISRKYDDSKEDGVVIEEFQRGYMLKERVLRPAIVCVNRQEISVQEEPSIDDNEENGE